MLIRPATSDDDAALWAVLEPVIRAGESFALPRDMAREAALAFWAAPGGDVFVAEDAGAIGEAESRGVGTPTALPAGRGASPVRSILGSYFVRPNQRGGGAHVANAGYVTAVGHTGRGIARAMCAHSLDHARARGFRAMQYNIVVSTNERAVRLWQAMGFAIVGRLPGAFAHPSHGDVDAFVMFQGL
jgi:ribosomal protein S18 acetylase RimI-like enzyme